VSRHVVVVGRGLIGSALVAALRAGGSRVSIVGRAGRRAPDYEACDLATPAGRDALLGALDRWAPDQVVLVHGPSDVTWMQGHPASAAGTHVGVARAVAARHGHRALLVSTDNVFAGTAGWRTAADLPDPANVYGRVKVAAEDAVRAAGGRVVRVSLVYGEWAAAGRRTTFAERCLSAALARRPLRVPVDQSFTPVHVDDVAAVLSRLCTMDRGAPDQALGTGNLAHLAGPEQRSRFSFARTAFRMAGADVNLVAPCRRADSEWAVRPRYSSLRCDDFAAVLGVTGWRPTPVTTGLARMLSQATRDGAAAAPVGVTR
jgi:dTDP-4-dehydrorhamnose reductase